MTAYYDVETESETSSIYSDYSDDEIFSILDSEKKNEFIEIKGSTDFLKKNNNHQILFGINNLKEYLKKKKITIR